MEWQIITSNDKADWINQRDGVFDNLIPLAPEKKFAMNAQCVFSTYAIGVATNQDAWVSGFSKDKVTSNMRSMIDFYNHEIEHTSGYSEDKTKISWTRALKMILPKGYNILTMKIFLYRKFIGHLQSCTCIIIAHS